MAQTDSMKSSAFDELMDWYTLDSGAYDAGVKRGRMEGEFRHSMRQFIEVYDLNRAAKCAELFIKKFYERFKGQSIVQARIGVNPASQEPTAFFVTDIPDSLYRESMQLNREVEREFAQNDSGRPICVWSVSGKVCQDTVVSDYPFLRKVVTKNA